MTLIIVTVKGDGRKAYVNPNNICAVYPNGQNEGAIIQFVGDEENYIRVAESADSIANMVAD